MLLAMIRFLSRLFLARLSLSSLFRERLSRRCRLLLKLRPPFGSAYKSGERGGVCHFVAMSEPRKVSAAGDDAMPPPPRGMVSRCSVYAKTRHCRR